MNRNRPRARLWQTTTFRLAVLFATIFGIGSAALLVVLDLAVADFAEETARDALRDQMAVLKADANAEGGLALISALREHVEGGLPERFSYVVIAPTGERLDAGLPRAVETISGWGELRIPTREEQPGPDPYNINLIVLTDRASDGTFIAVGRDDYALSELREWLHKLAVWGGSAMVLLALLGGVAAGLILLNRLKAVGAAAEKVMRGDLSERLPSLGLGREFDDLADILNVMLERVEDAMVALRQVSSDVAHDLRTPLTRLRNTLEEAQQADASQRDGLLAEAIGDTDRLLEIFSALLRLAQIEGGAERRFIVMNLTEIVDDVVEAYRPAAEEGEGALTVQADGPAIMSGDPTMLAQVVASLIDNAITHGGPGGAIVIAVRALDEQVELSVTDNGPGAPAEELSKLTRRFYRLDRSRNTVGSGLGLSMVAAIVDLHRGELILENSHPGLRVRMVFPRG